MPESGARPDARMMAVTPINKLNEQVYEIIKKEIIEYKFEPGKKLSVDWLSKQMGVSRTPVSNALQALERDGYVEIVPQSGTYVRELSIEEIKEIYELREEIEGLVVRIAINKVEKKQLKDFLARMKHFSELPEAEEVLLDFYQIDLKFHEYLATFCTRIIQKEIHNIIDLTKRSRRLNLLHELSQKGFKEILDSEIENHSKIINALLDRNVELAVALVRNDVRETKERVLEFYSDNRK